MSSLLKNFFKLTKNRCQLKTLSIFLRSFKGIVTKRKKKKTLKSTSHCFSNIWSYMIWYIITFHKSPKVPVFFKKFWILPHTYWMKISEETKTGNLMVERASRFCFVFLIHIKFEYIQVIVTILKELYPIQIQEQSDL